MKHGTVYVDEEEDEEHFLLGRFTCVWDTGDTAQDGPADVALDDALAWGRDRADEVIVCLGRERFSAGESRVPEHPVLPASIVPPCRRRAPDYWYLDRAQDDPAIDWPVELDLHQDAEIPVEAAEAFFATVAADPRISRVTRGSRPISLAGLPSEQIRGAVQVSALLSARTYNEAEDIVDQIHATARQAAGQMMNASSETPVAWYGGTSVGAPDRPTPIE